MSWASHDAQHIASAIRSNGGCLPVLALLLFLIWWELDSIADALREILEVMR